MISIFILGRYIEQTPHRVGGVLVIMACRESVVRVD